MPRTVLELYHGGWSGGTAAYLTTLLGHLDLSRYRPLYLGYRGDPGLQRLSEGGVEVRAVASRRELWSEAKRSGAVIVHTHGVRANAEGVLLRRTTDLRHVVTVHSRLDQDYRSESRRLIARMLDDPGLRGAHAVIAVSEAIREDLIGRRVPARAIHVVESGVSGARRPWTRGALHEAFAIPEDRLVLVSVARHQPVKGLDVLLAALGLVHREPGCPDFALLLFGEGPDTDALREKARREGIADRVKFLGYRADVQDVLSGADLFVLPSRAEGFGLAALEAMAAGLPVVASAVGNLPTLMDQGRCGVLVPPEDVPSLAAATLGLLTDPARRATLAALGQARYRECFTPEGMAERTMAVWDTVLEGV